MDNMEFWNKVARPPKGALKKISGGRLSGMTDISPIWRVQVLTEHYGPCGTGWNYTIDKLWTVDGSDGQVFAMAQIFLTIGDNTPIPGVGGNFLVIKEKSGLHNSDEGFKMALTDAIGNACKMLGVAADIYKGKWNGQTYIGPEPNISKDQSITISALATEVDADYDKFLAHISAKFKCKIAQIDDIPARHYTQVIDLLEAKRNA